MLPQLTEEMMVWEVGGGIEITVVQIECRGNKVVLGERTKTFPTIQRNDTKVLKLLKHITGAQKQLVNSVRKTRRT